MIVLSDGRYIFLVSPLPITGGITLLLGFLLVG